MINNPRKFAITWLLEPTTKGYTYEYRFKFITFHTEPISIMVDETDRRYPPLHPYEKNLYEYDLRTPPNDFVIPQATVFRVNARTGSREKLGIIEYLNANTIGSKYSYRSEADEWTEYTKYIPILESPCLAFTQPYDDPMIRKWGTKITYSSSGKLFSRSDYIATYPSEAYTADFFHFTGVCPF